MRMKRGLRQIFQHVPRPFWMAPTGTVLLLAAFLLGWGQPALAEEKFCSDYPNGVIDGNVIPFPFRSPSIETVRSRISRHPIR
ncbi:MAG: hypothetical protein P8Y73_05560 [Desulfuromonadales bacterium]